MSHGQTGTYETYAPNAPSATVHEGRAAAEDAAPAADAFIYRQHIGGH
jgi:hypothetical protein